MMINCCIKSEKMINIKIQHYRARPVHELLKDQEIAKLDVQPPTWTVPNYDIIIQNDKPLITEDTYKFEWPQYQIMD